MSYSKFLNKLCMHTSLPSSYRYNASDRLRQGGYNNLSSLFQTFSVPSGEADTLLKSLGLNDNQFNGVCRLSASVPRVMVFESKLDHANISGHCPDTDMVVSNVEVPEIGEICSNRPHV